MKPVSSPHPLPRCRIHRSPRSMCAGGTLTVGVTSDSMLKKKSNANMVSNLSERLEGVTDFLRCAYVCTPAFRADFSGCHLLGNSLFI